MKLFLFVDPCKDLLGSLRPPYLLARAFKKHFEPIFVSPSVDGRVAEALVQEGFEVVSLGKRYWFHGSLLFF
jgi:hypothetical protein